MSKILVIDDQKNITTMVQLMLEEDGHEVTCSNNPGDTFPILAEDIYDLLITDVIMPGKSGIELVSEIKEEYDNLQVIVMSGGGQTMDSRTAVDIAGMHADFKIQKPFTAAELSLAVSALLAARRPLAS